MISASAGGTPLPVRMEVTKVVASEAETWSLGDASDAMVGVELGILDSID